MPQPFALHENTRVSTQSLSLAALGFKAELPFQFDFSWLREPERGVFDGGSALRFRAAAPAALAAQLAGQFRIDISPGVHGSCRAVVSAVGKAAAALRVSVTEPDETDPLLAALLGLHPIQWMRRMLTSIGSNQWSAICRCHSARPQHLETLLDLFSQLTASEEAHLWDALDAGKPLHNEPLADILGSFGKKAALLAGPGPAVPPPATDAPAARRRLQRPIISTKRTRELFEARVDAENLRFTPARIFGDPGPARQATALDLARHPGFDTFRQYFERSRLVLDGVERSGDAALELFALLVRLHRTASTTLQPRAWSVVARAQAVAMLGALPDLGTLHSRLEPWRDLRRAIYDCLPAALESRLVSSVAAVADSGPLFVADFDASPAARRQLDRLRNGDLTAAFEPVDGVAIHRNILEGVLDANASVDLRMPFFERNLCRKRAEVINTCRPTVSAPGEIFVPPPAQKSLLPARAVEWGSEPFKAAIARDNRQPVSDNQVLSWRFDFDLAPSVSPGSSMETWRPVFALHGLPLHPLASTAGRAALDVCLNGAALSAWTRTPHGRDAGFHAVFSAVAEYLQRVARAWIPAAFFSSPGRLNDSAAAATLLAYSATPVFRGGGRADYAWDTMNPGDVAKALAAAASHLPLRLARLNMELKREGHPGAALLAPGLASRFIDKVAANRRMYHLLLAFDSFLIEDVIRMAESARDMRQRVGYGADTLARRLQHESPAFLRAVHARFRQLGDYPELLRLGELLLMEATAALAAARTDAAFSVQSGGFVTAWTPRRALDEALAA